ncbi:MAG TPA: response regulator transcription factor [Terriglobales bacterium]|nr:response regulator transcription factor [Terriglobales bacterium]
MRILIVEDHQQLSRQIAEALATAGYVAEISADGEDGVFRGETDAFDAIILDLGLPRLDGLSVLQDWRKRGNKVPVLILTARDSWREKVQGLRAGADDYLTKPFQMEELIARVEALIRRSHGHGHPVLRCGEVQIDTASGTVTRAGGMVVLTALECRLLSYLMHRAGEVVSKSTLTEHIYDQTFDRDSNVIEVMVNRLRKKLGTDFIRTRRGIGYVIDRDEATEQASMLSDAPASAGQQRS